MATADPLRQAALVRLRGGFVCVLHSECLGGDLSRPAVVTARVRSTRENARPHRVELTGGRWTCTCGATECGHLLATKLVTGFARGAA